MGTQETFQPVDLRRDVGHISQLQGSHNVFAKEMNAGLDVLRGNGERLERFPDCQFDLGAFRNECLMGCCICLRYAFRLAFLCWTLQQHLDLFQGARKVVAQKIT